MLLSNEQSTMAGSGPKLRGLGEALGDISTRFSTEGALGVIRVDAGALSGIERSYGSGARRRAMGSLAALLCDSIGERLGIGDEIVTGETGRDEIVVLLFREAAEVAFYKRELPDLARRLAEAIATSGHRVGYPYLRSAPTLPIGTATALRNPTLEASTQLRAALREARRDGELTSANLARRRRQRLFELVIEGQVRSVYEPIVEVTSRTVFGYEALARGPEGTELHSPLALFASATEEDLLFQLDCLCRKSGLDGARDLPGGAKLFLNIRPTTMHDPNFRAETVVATLERVNLRPSDVVFEISEQESIQNFEIFREVRDYYGKLGFQIALDDVGAGYSSLEAVIELRPEFIKVDRAFVKDIHEDPMRQELLRALLSVSRKIGSQIIGEGLSTLEELETLGDLDIPFGQGWLFGKPHPLRTDT